MKKKILFVVSLFVATAAVSAQPTGTDIKQKRSPAEPGGVGSKKEHRIEVDRDGLGAPVRVKFVSPADKTIKTLPADKTIISKNGRNLIYREGGKTDENNRYEEHGVSLFNSKGETKWRKKWKNYPQYGVDPEAGFDGWSEGIADSGERSYITNRDEDGVYYLTVIDESGKEIAKAGNPGMLTDIEISPDGKLVGANTFVIIDGKSVKHLFFLDVDTGKTKLVKASGWRYVLSTGGPLVPNKILLRFGGPNAGYKKIYLEFEAIPMDLSKLLLN